MATAPETAGIPDPAKIPETAATPAIERVPDPKKLRFMVDVYCRGIADPIRLTDDTLLPSLLAFLDGWPCEIRPVDDARTPIIAIQCHPDGACHITAPWLSPPLYAKNATRLFCNLAVDLVIAHLKADPGLLGCHAAAVAIDGRAVVFPNVNRSGKSLLTACFMANGHCCYGDDLIALTREGMVRSFGLPPRLRLPLPPLPEFMEGFIRRHLAFQDRHYGFLQAGSSVQAGFGHELPVGAVVIIERHDTGQAKIEAVDHDTALKKMIHRCLLLNPGQALAAVERAQEMLAAIPTWRLVYANPQTAVAMLRKIVSTPWFTGNARDSGRTQITPGNTGIPVSVSPSQRFMRNCRIVCRNENECLFLVEPDTEKIFHLNHFGSVVWAFLHDPLCPAEVIDSLGLAFHNVPKETITHDVLALFAALAAEGLILPANAHPPKHVPAN